MSGGYDDPDLADLAMTLGGMMRSVGSRWAARAEAGRLGTHRLAEVLRLAKSLELAAELVETAGAEPRAGTEDVRAPIAASEERFRRLVDGVLDYAIFMLDVD